MDAVRVQVHIIGYLGYQIEENFGDGSEYGVRISYVKEDVPLGTAGALYYLKRIVDEDFLLINGDIIFDVDIRRFARMHCRPLHCIIIAV